MQKVTTFDDISGEPEATTHTFGLDGKEYRIDLAEKNAAKLEQALSEFIEKAEPVRATRATGARRTRRSSDGDSKPARIREWAKRHDIVVSERGRIPLDIEEQFDAFQEHLEDAEDADSE